ncbi:UNVERIFIED_CONTAM: hypothetical protein Sindi_3038200 [Sesamum indicum]
MEMVCGLWISGNRVWIAWNDSFIDVDVVECGTQFIHCLVTIRAIHESIAVTVAYGATEVVDRRELWNTLENLAIQCADIPWMIGGDFNAVRDLSEVCGTSGDIRTAMEDFNAAIQNTGLLPLPMQGSGTHGTTTVRHPKSLEKTGPHVDK